MLTDTGTTFRNLPFLQDPSHFLETYFWGCNEGHNLSVKCKQQLEHTLSSHRTTQGSKPHLQPLGEVMDSVLNCYVHTQVCRRCVSMEKVTCQQGYELMEERDSASDHAMKIGVTEETLGAHWDQVMSEEQIQAAFNKAFTQEKFLHHKTSCEICTLKQPRGRYSVAAWNIDIARSQGLD